MTCGIPHRIEVHTADRSYVIRQIAADPKLYVVYFRERGVEQEEFIHRDGRTLDEAIAAMKEHKGVAA